jgi:hypothetical protein
VLYSIHGKAIEPKAASPLLYFAEGLSSPPDEREEGDTMYVTYQDLIQIEILIVALANLIYQVYKGKRNSRHYSQ